MYATMLQERYGDSLANTVFDQVLSAPLGTHDPQCLNNHAIHLDEDLDMPGPAEKWYEAAVAASNRKSASILGDYAYFRYSPA